MAMPKKDSPMNFKAMDYEMAKAMDYNQGKPMMYGDMPKMDHGAKMAHSPKMAYGDKPKMDHGKAKMMSKDGKHTGKVVNIGGRNYDTRSSEYRALQKKIQKQEKQDVQIKGGRYTGRSTSGTTQMS
jgi:hypothetical protein